MPSIETLRFLTEDTTRKIAAQFGTPVFVYHAPTIEKIAQNALDFPNAFGLTVRYAMKANPNAAILQIFDKLGLHIDASSGYEAQRAILAGIKPAKIMLTAQEMPTDLVELVKKGVIFNACSLRQLDTFGQNFPGSDICVRLNPGLGSGSTNRTNVGGPAASFGIWHQDLEKVFQIAKKYNLNINKLHTHIGSGSDPAVWQKVAIMCLDFVRKFPNVTTLSLGGGYKVGRMTHEPSTDLKKIGQPVRQALLDFHQETSRKIHLEIEPGTYLLANAGALIATVQDVNDTGQQGYQFLKLDTGMTDLQRPALYGAQHPIIVVPQPQSQSEELKHYIVTGHCCESGDVLTPAPGDPEALMPRLMRSARIGDLVVIEGAGAYCSAMCAKNYNSFPESPEVLLHADNTFALIRRRQTLEQIIQNEQPA
ncbi:MAG: diaminopimelate decarboxylase [Sedimentisphaerales bacterium]|nr:diaminopimelate decarboxylase [Sedimentisphaerales bacterium]